MKNIILASSSPRRIEMMKEKGYNPEIMPADIEETLPMKMRPQSAVMYLALKKAYASQQQFLKLSSDESKEETKPQNFKNNFLIIAADTVVVYNNKIIGKPKDKTEAFDILSSLRNDRHRVITGVCIIDTENNTKKCFCDETSVFFTDYSNEELTIYVNTSEPYDKAGGYAIQGTFKKYVDHIEGDYNNVVGFPWDKIKSELPE